MKAYSFILGTPVARGIALLCSIAVVGAPLIASASGVVGTGTADSCTDAALDTALAGGGLVTFNCGGPVTIDISTGTGTKTIAADTTVDGGGLVTISGGKRVTVFVNPSFNFTVKNLTIANGNSLVGGGGGIDNGGVLTVINSTFADNRDGGISSITIGGNATLTVMNSTFFGNTAGWGGAIFSGAFNGGIATLTVTNSTFFGNSALEGGGIANYKGSLTVNDSTFSGNRYRDPGSASAIFSVDGTATVSSTIIANGIECWDDDDHCHFGRINCSYSVAISDGGHNLDDGGSCGFSATNGSLSETDPHLDPAGLRNNGGPTQTVALCTGVGVPAGCTAASPAIDAGDDAVTGPPLALTTDQRGRARKSGLHVDIGAYEAGATITVNDTGDNTTAQDSECTLREAIANVNAADDTTGGDCTAGTGNGDTVVFDLALPATILLTTNIELAISKDVTISGPTSGTLAVEGNLGTQTRVFEIMAGTVSVEHLAIRKGRNGFDSGGGISVADGARVALTNCTLSGNYAPSGGGIAVSSGGTATLTNCTLSGNTANVSGGGIANSGKATLTNCTLSSNTLLKSALGGGIANNGTATLTNCTLSDNSGAIANTGAAVLTNCTLSGNSGYGISLLGGTATLTNCTLSANGDAASLYGGAVTLTNCTLSGNRRGIFNYDGEDDGVATLTNTIVANSLDGGNCGGDGAIVDGGHNLSGDDTCVFGPSTDPRLAPLANYGGPTATLALCTAVGVPDASCNGASPAIDAGDQAVCAMAPVNSLDQRGFVRPGAGHTACSIGAYEADPSGPPNPTATPSATPTPTSTPVPSATPSASPTLSPSVTTTPTRTVTRTPTGSATPSPSATLTATTPPSGGGGCASTPTGGGDTGWWLLVFALLLARRRRTARAEERSSA